MGREWCSRPRDLIHVGQVHETVGEGCGRKVFKGCFYGGAGYGRACFDSWDCYIFDTVATVRWLGPDI